jgi:hypothetical protein
MSEAIRDGKFVELTYKVTDRKSGHVLACVESPLGYVHGRNAILAPADGRRQPSALRQGGRLTLGILTVSDATHEEMKAGGAIGAAPNIDPSAMRPVRAAVSEAGLVIELGNPDFQK